MHKNVWNYRVAVIAILILLCNVSAGVAQQTTVTPNSGGAAAAASGVQQCAWTMTKPFAMWGYLDVELKGGRVYAQRREENGAVGLVDSVNINTTYLPSETLTCWVRSAGVQFGSVVYPSGTSYQINHSNPDCDPYPPLTFPSHPTSSWWISEELYNTNFFIANSISTGAGYYWGAVGSDINYPELSTPQCCDVGFYPSSSLPPNVRADFNPTTRIIRINVVNYNHYNEGKWQAVASQELGHAVGFDHAQTTDWLHTIMVNLYFDQEGLLPRTGDKCGAVKAFPVNINLG